MLALILGVSMILIGSAAFAQFDLSVVSTDIDLVGSYQEIYKLKAKLRPKLFYPTSNGDKIFMRLKTGEIYDLEIAWPNGMGEKLVKFIQQYPHSCTKIELHGFQVDVPGINLQLLLKMSHRYKKNSAHFLKTMRHIHRLRNLGAIIPPEWQDYYHNRMADTYSYHHPNLSVSKTDFFNVDYTGVPQVYDHDSIHEVVAIDGKPAYLHYKIPGQEVQCSKDLFYSVPASTRINGVVEEAMVLALERSIVPYPGAMTDDQAFTKALEKVCTSITSGWFREFAWEHYDAALSKFHLLQTDSPLSEKFNQAVINGTVKMKETI